ncbi:unnamed protein product [Prorocentrum cordatum]|uniref:NADP-dependent oxidoreductase domain-containing protein n=1 Tax=Prorocentrum cordatum TaxID=2364126 RepID=A0ABN9QBY8_9DINO|nr:unnamed protein product [Polarella glacialis]
MAAGARAALRALLALLCCGAPCAVGGVALRPRAGPGDVKVPRVRLPGGGGAMPMAGLGLPKCEPDAAVGGDCREKARNATLEFLLLGGRLLDTALAYENHRAVGAAIREAVDRHGVRREDLRWATMWRGMLSLSACSVAPRSPNDRCLTSRPRRERGGEPTAGKGRALVWC